MKWQDIEKYILNVTSRILSLQSDFIKNGVIFIEYYINSDKLHYI